jgi:hypothetical protein
MNATIAKLIKDYKREYLRVNGRTPDITVKGGWITLNGCEHYRKTEIDQALIVLQGRKDFWKK